MPDAKPNVLPAGVEPASDAGIGVAMQDFAIPIRDKSTVPQAEAPRFDTWLRRHLGQLHAEVLTEPVPERFLRLMDRLGD
ncbi:NepR family anti-sigma factor [Dankookia sp. P2]|uniref:NepR family anti-sigma factor n=1 Tax=Dankookia sp. P2 TaxID=3423955 RepID=UPI003D67C852